jgi:hypothetical protein
MMSSVRHGEQAKIIQSKAKAQKAISGNKNRKVTHPASIEA